MATISDERREVAARLRNLAGHIAADEELTLDALGLYRGENIEGFDTYGVMHLADLIDRPTTTRHGKFKTKYGSKTPCCEVCGYSIGDMRWSYCPKCGAVIDDD